MENFSFRPKSVKEIASTVAKSAASVTVTNHPDGQVDVETPDLTAAQRTALKNLFTVLGLVEVV